MDSDGTSTQMDLQVADTLSNYVIEAVKRNNFAPIVVTVVDIQANILGEYGVVYLLSICIPLMILIYISTRIQYKR